MTESTHKNIQGFVLIAFLLLAALFGMIIMTFIFGNVATGLTTSFSTLETQIVGNETTGFINDTAYTFNAVSNRTFRGAVVVFTVFNTSSSTLVAEGNYTVNGALGTIIGTADRDENYTAILISYSYDVKREAEIISEDVSNNSLGAIRTYSAQSSTQFTTVAIAITLAILIAVFLLFWKAFMGGSLGMGRGKERGSDKSSGMDI